MKNSFKLDQQQKKTSKNMAISLFLFFLSLSALLVDSSESPTERSLYIVHMDKSLMPKMFMSHEHWYSSLLRSAKPSSAAAVDDHPSLVYTYDHVAHGFSALVSPAELETLKMSPGFVSAYPDEPFTEDTTHSPDFLGLSPSSGLWNASLLGEDVIIGMIDSGVWPENLSFKDEGMSQHYPSHWRGTCQEGQEFNASLCNYKLIGAQYFNKGLTANHNLSKLSMNSTRDTKGHGTHTASTAAGNYVKGASFFGYAKGTATGIAPRARLAVYKVTWSEGRCASDVLAAMDKAVADGVDVISISLGYSGKPLYMDPVAIASFGAMEKGVFVSTSAGNEGLKLGNLHNGIPWALTVASATIDRSFAGILTLGNGVTLTGWSLFPASALLENVPLIYDGKWSSCNSTLPVSDHFSNSIILCDNTTLLNKQVREILSSRVRAAILVSDDPNLRQTPFPGVIIRTKDWSAVFKYATGSDDPRASIMFQQTILGTKPAPVVLTSSSTGPSRAYPEVLKPDILAPGFLILAAYPPNQAVAEIGRDIELSSYFYLDSGTSMACPHASGAAALLRGAHPEWSAAAIRSALMTSANPLDNTMEPIKHMDYLSTDSPAASSLSTGAGFIDPNRALDPGLIYDAGPQDYVNLLCSKFSSTQISTITRSNTTYTCENPSTDVNYPSYIAFYNSSKTETLVQTFNRTVTHVGDGATSYNASVVPPKGSAVTVSPTTLSFAEINEKKSYTVSITYTSDDKERVFSGEIVWVEHNGKHRVRSPIVVSPLVDQIK